jgi:hypothetical protein
LRGFGETAERCGKAKTSKRTRVTKKDKAQGVGRRVGFVLGCYSEELAGVGWGFAGVFVFEIDVDIDTLVEPRVDALPPGFQLLGRVVFETQAGIGERGGDYVGGSLLFGFGEAEGGLVLAKGGVGFVGVPGRMTHFKGEKERGRSKDEKIFEQGAIEFEGGRELNEDWAQVVAVI